MKSFSHILFFAGFIAGLMITPAGAQVTQQSPIILPSDADIRKMLAERVDGLAGQDDGIGIVVGILGPQGKKVISYGHLNQGDPRTLDGNTNFEIASVGKTFTALLLAEMVQKGEVKLTDPVSKYLPAGVKLPERDGHSITFVDLATHTSSLPFMPAGEFTSSADLYRYLAGYELTRDIGSQWDYSNIGYWLLGEALASRSGMKFEDILRTRVLAPLKLSSTDFALTPNVKSNLAQGHDGALQPAPAASTLPVYSLMPAAGLLYSSVNDLLRVLLVAMGYEHSQLDAAMAACLSTRRPKGSPNHEQGLGWNVIGKGQDELIFHDGGSAGFASCVVWDPARRVGVAVLSNQVASVADIGLHMLRPEIPLEHPTITRHNEIILSTALLDSYAGKYDSPGEGIFGITREGNSLMFEAPAEWGLPKLRIRAERTLEFFASELPLRVIFESGGDGHVSGMLVYPPRGQKAVPAKRMDAGR